MYSSGVKELQGTPVRPAYRKMAGSWSLATTPGSAGCDANHASGTFIFTERLSCMVFHQCPRNPSTLYRPTPSPTISAPARAAALATRIVASRTAVPARGRHSQNATAPATITRTTRNHTAQTNRNGGNGQNTTSPAYNTANAAVTGAVLAIRASPATVKAALAAIAIRFTTRGNWGAN